MDQKQLSAEELFDAWMLEQDSNLQRAVRGLLKHSPYLHANFPVAADAKQQVFNLILKKGPQYVINELDELEKAIAFGLANLNPAEPVDISQADTRFY